MNLGPSAGSFGPQRVLTDVNLQIESALAAAPETVPSLWHALRNRWEYGHAIGFALHLLGFCALVVSLIREGDGPAFIRRSPLPLA